MHLILWIIAAALIVVGIIKLSERQWFSGLVLLVGGLLIGPGGASLLI